MYKYAQNSVVKISMRFAKYFEYNTPILRGPFCGHAVLYTPCTESQSDFAVETGLGF